ncbi:MAG TPA: sugar phosphate isomerase/epimerase [Arachnia sp.]|nr:sugar phosphate isomerase/epimerase [Arachnia sp.]
MITLANAPVSYGVFGLARPDLVEVPSGPRLLELVRDAGYTGIDLGAHGLLGVGQGLVDNLAEHGLALAGGWLDYPFAGDDESFERAFLASLPVLDDFALVADAGLGRRPLPTIADSGSAERKARPGGSPELELDGERWALFVRRLERVAQAVRERGLEPTFHHHASTYIETPREIERLLADTTVDLTFDSGHLLLGGGEPDDCFRRWARRINHLHLKDADLEILRGAQGAKDVVREVWEKKVFVALGAGDLDVAGLLDDIQAHGYDGWLVVEQDVVLLSQDDLDAAIADQAANRELLRRWFA